MNGIPTGAFGKGLIVGDLGISLKVFILVNSAFEL
jgi:hypothetical protein